MTESAASQAASVYQLRVVLRAVSPLIWRRLLVPGEASLTDLHRVLQAAFGWSDVHLHRFKVQGREYDGIYDAGHVRLGELGLRATERFVYDYDLGDLWRHEIRVDQLLDREGGRVQAAARCARASTLGLQLNEAKSLLSAVQTAIVEEQVRAALAGQVACPVCGTPRRHKDAREIVVRSLFGTLRLPSPRWLRCPLLAARDQDVQPAAILDR